MDIALTIRLFVDMFLRRFVGPSARQTATPEQIIERRRYEATAGAAYYDLLAIAATLPRQTWGEAYGPARAAWDEAWNAALATDSHARSLARGWERRLEVATSTVLVRRTLTGLGVDTSAVPVRIMERLWLGCERLAAAGHQPRPRY